MGAKRRDLGRKVGVSFELVKGMEPASDSRGTRTLATKKGGPYRYDWFNSSSASRAPAGGVTPSAADGAADSVAVAFSAFSSATV